MRRPCPDQRQFRCHPPQRQVNPKGAYQAAPAKRSGLCKRLPGFGPVVCFNFAIGPASASDTSAACGPGPSPVGLVLLPVRHHRGNRRARSGFGAGELGLRPRYRAGCRLAPAKRLGGQSAPAPRRPLPRFRRQLAGRLLSRRIICRSPARNHHLCASAFAGLRLISRPREWPIAQTVPLMLGIGLASCTST